MSFLLTPDNEHCVFSTSGYSHASPSPLPDTSSPELLELIVVLGLAHSDFEKPASPRKSSPTKNTPLSSVETAQPLTSESKNYKPRIVDAYP